MCGIVDRVVGDGGTEEGLRLYPWERVGPWKGFSRLYGCGCMVVVGSDGWDMLEASFEQAHLAPTDDTDLKTNEPCQ